MSFVHCYKVTGILEVLVCVQSTVEVPEGVRGLSECCADGNVAARHHGTRNED